MTDTPKILRDMTDAEIGALVRAYRNGSRIHLWLGDDWDASGVAPLWSLDTAYRIAPPKFLPLEAGKVYVQEDGAEVKCIHVDGGFAHMRSVGYKSAAAYVWHSETGKTKSMALARYNIVGLSENQEADQ